MSTITMKNQKIDHKLEEADCAMLRVLRYFEGLGETGKPRISLLIKEAKDDGTDHSGKL